MALTPRLDVKLSQQLVMTPQLQQAIKLLQLSNIDLQLFVRDEVEKNPLLDIEGTTTFGGDVSSSSRQESIEKDHEKMEQTPIEDGAESPSEDMQHFSARFEGSYSEDTGNLLEQTIEETDTLHEFLTRQMFMTIHDPKDQLLAAHLIDMVNPSGYINQEDVADLAERLGLQVEEIDPILLALQTLEPTGVFARNLTECLALQLKELDHFDPAMEIFLDHLDLLARRDFAALKKICAVDSADLADMVDEIRHLNPKPGLTYDHEPTQTVVPDIFVKKNENGRWVVELNTQTLPKVLVNEKYMTELSINDADTDMKTFISECFTQANWLVKSLDQRAKTILKVATELVKKQEMFFEHGIRHMKPLIMKDIADEIAMHESSISRVVNNKFMATPRGVFELKYFFSSAISAADGGEMHAAESVKARIKDLIDGEDKKKILSDDKLVILLKEEGVDIARRTVAKYRESLHISSSVQRRREKNMTN